MMMMMDYGSQFTGSTISSDTMSGSVDSVQPRVRTVRLVRPCTGTLPPPGITARHGPNLGFSARGGREHGTGYFVSVVEPGSEAHRQGLRVGDQIVRINGFTVEDAVHKEVLQLISNHTHLTLKVRSVGMIPVKDRSTDPLSWQIISDSTSSTRSSPQLGDKVHDVRISIMVAPRTKLGCGICKGPEWKPGIFVQFTKEGGIAREAGLRPGDQILYCNNVDFGDIQFNEAVNIMKTARQLDLVVRKSAGSELFPGESSGYNSSASSVTGDQSPSWSDSKRLSIVKEESLDLEDRLSQLDRLKSSKWEKIEWDDVENDEKRYQFKPTIINLSDSGTTISNNGSSQECQNVDSNKNTLTRNKSNKLADICLVSHQQETKTVVVEVHRSTSEESAKTDNTLNKSPSICSYNSVTSRSSDTSSSLSSAISQELQRRSERKKTEASKPSIDEQLQKRKILKGVDTDKQQQHSKLMDEFKKVHRKMFKAVDEDKEAENEAKEKLADRECSRQLAPKSVERHSTQPIPEAVQDKPVTRQNATPSPSADNPPPPPPPPPFSDEKPVAQQNGVIYDLPNTQPKPKPKVAPPVPIKYSTLSYSKEKPEYPQPPPCPTPDYDTISINSESTLSKAIFNRFAAMEAKTSQNHNDSVEMESLESFRLNNPANPWPNPPSTYFNKPKAALSAQLSNGSTRSSASGKKQRPVSVTIGEYPSGSLRRQPGKLDFLQKHSSDENERHCNGSISSQLASELASTLSRSNLRKRTESMENLLNGQQIKPQSNGSVTISLNNTLNRNFAKSTDNLNNLRSADGKPSNRVTISISANDRKAEVPNGILKNGNGNHNFHNHPHKPLVQQKSITFGEIPTVINDQLRHVT